LSICLEEKPMAIERQVKLFRNGRNQAVRIPREFELPGEDAIIRKDGNRLIIEPAPARSLLAVLATLPTLDEEFPPIDDLPAEPVDL
jgi:antitoxin VapB